MRQLPPPLFPPVLLDVLDEHFDTLEFLWEQRETILCAPDWNLQELAEHEERIAAHADGLRLSGDPGIRLSRERLASGERASSLVATICLLESDSDAHTDEVFAAFAEAEDEHLDGIRCALRFADVDAADLARRLSEIEAAPNSPLMAAIWDVQAFRGFPCHPTGDVTQVEDPAPKIWTMAAIARSRTPLSGPVLESILHDAEPAVRRAGMLAAAKQAHPDLAANLERIGTRPTDPDPTALEMLGVLDSEGIGPRLAGLVEERADLALACLRGLGALGDPAHVPALIGWMSNEKLAREAGWAFTRVTGIEGCDLPHVYPDLTLSVDEDDEDAASEDEGRLPDPELATKRWAAMAERFQEGERYQYGALASDPRLLTGEFLIPLQSRGELILRAQFQGQPGVPNIELESPARVQVAGPR